MPVWAFCEVFRRGHQFFFGGVDSGIGVEMEDLTVGVLVVGDRTLARLPRGDRAKEDAVPVHVEKTFSIVVPNRGERASRPETLPGGDEALDVPQRCFVARVNLVPV